MNGRLELRIITPPYSEIYWGYFRRLVFGNSLTKHIKLSSFSYSVVIFFLPISHVWLGSVNLPFKYKVQGSHQKFKKSSPKFPWPFYRQPIVELYRMYTY